MVPKGRPNCFGRRRILQSQGIGRLTSSWLNCFSLSWRSAHRLRTLGPAARAHPLLGPNVYPGWLVPAKPASSLSPKEAGRNFRPARPLPNEVALLGVPVRRRRQIGGMAHHERRFAFDPGGGATTVCPDDVSYKERVRGSMQRLRMRRWWQGPATLPSSRPMAPRANWNLRASVPRHLSGRALSGHVREDFVQPAQPP
jgi:hypothetical protein